MSNSQLKDGKSAGTGLELRDETPALGVALVLMLMFMGATLPTPLYIIYRDELHFSQVTLTLIYAVYFGGAITTAFFFGRLSDEIGRRVAILAAVAISMVATFVFLFAELNTDAVSRPPFERARHPACRERRHRLAG